MEYKIGSDSVATSDFEVKEEDHKIMFTNADFECVKCNICSKSFVKNGNFTVTFQNKNYFYICWECTANKLKTVLAKELVQ